jgi:hypothetical protein
MNQRQRVSSFFVIVEERRRQVVKGLRVEKGVARELADAFEGQAADFLGPDVERIPFDHRFKPETDQAFLIDNFTLPEQISRAVMSPDGVDPFLPKQSEPANLRAVFASTYDPATESMTILLQGSNRSRVLEVGSAWIFSGETLRRLNEPGLTLDSGLIAIFDAGDLIFRSFHKVNPLLDLRNYFMEATEPEVQTLLQHEMFSADETAPLVSFCDSKTRKQVAYIQASKILDRVTARKVCSSLKTLFDDIDISYTTRGGIEKLKLPRTKRDFKRLIKHLCEGYYIGDLTGEKYETNSHRRMS